MIKEIEISVPTSYGDITLKKWIELQKEIKNYEGDDDAITALMLYHLLLTSTLLAWRAGTGTTRYRLNIGQSNTQKSYSLLNSDI